MSKKAIGSAVEISVRTLLIKKIQNKMFNFEIILFRLFFY